MRVVLQKSMLLEKLWVYKVKYLLLEETHLQKEICNCQKIMKT